MRTERSDESVIATGMSYPEGPCFDAAGVLHIVELAGGVVSKVVNGERLVLSNPGGSPNGAAFDRTGQLYICNNGGNWGPNASTGMVAGPGGGAALIQRIDRDGSHHTVVDRVGSRPLNSPNDLAFDPRGGFWFTDPAWAERDGEGGAAASDSPPGDVCFATDSGDAIVCAGSLLFPNGLALTPDNNYLIVGETGTGNLLRYPILGAGSLGEAQLWCALGPDAFPDGMCFDSVGRLIVAGTGSGKLFVVTDDGVVEREIVMDDVDVTNVCFGGEDGRDLFVTEAALGRVISMKWDVPGLRLPVGPSPW